MIGEFRRYKETNGVVMPNAGGWDDQSAAWVDSVAVLEGELIKLIELAGDKSGTG